MKRESSIPRGIADEICALLGSSAGPAGAAVAGGVCDVAIKGINGVINGMSDPGKDSIPEIKNSYQYLANTLKSHGCIHPIYTDPVQLRNFFLRDRPSSGMGLSASIKEQAQFVNALADFLNKGSVIQVSYPTFINDAVSYFFDYYRRWNFSLGKTVEEMNRLAEKAIDPRQSFYVISILKGNYQAALLFGMLANYGKIDDKTYKDFSDLSISMTKMLGKQSSEVLLYNSMIDAKSRLNAKLFADRLETFEYFISIEKSVIKIEEEILDATYPMVKGLLHNPAIAKFLPYIVGLGQLKDVAKYIASGAGQAMTPGGLNH
jgi:hypothetical protein